MPCSPRGLFFIPARSGSKGFFKKNGREILGRSLIDHAISCATESGFPWQICLSTDDEAWRKAHIEIAPFLRPSILASDTAQSLDVMIHALDWFRDRGDSYDFICLLEPPGVLREVGDIQRGYRLFEKHDFQNTVVSICSVGDSHPIRMKSIKDDGETLEDFIPEPQGLRRQNQSPLFIRNSFVYFFPVNSLRNGVLYTTPTYGFEINRLGANVNIDSEEDYITARAIKEGWDRE